jgi:hypothetical protein
MMAVPAVLGRFPLASGWHTGQRPASMPSWPRGACSLIALAAPRRPPRPHRGRRWRQRRSRPAPPHQRRSSPCRARHVRQRRRPLPSPQFPVRALYPDADRGPAEALDADVVAWATSTGHAVAGARSRGSTGSHASRPLSGWSLLGCGPGCERSAAIAGCQPGNCTATAPTSATGARGAGTAGPVIEIAIPGRRATAA